MAKIESDMEEAARIANLIITIGQSEKEEAGEIKVMQLKGRSGLTPYDTTFGFSLAPPLKV